MLLPWSEWYWFWGLRLCLGSRRRGARLRRRAPAQHALLERRDQRLGRERDQRDDEHPGEHAIGPEGVHRCSDDQAEALLGTEQLADDRADDREAERDVEARDDPCHRRWEHDVAGDLEAARAEHAGVGDQVAVHFPDALEGVE